MSNKKEDKRKNEILEDEKEVMESQNADANPDDRVHLGAKIKHFLRYSIQTWIVRCFLIAFGLELLLEILGRRSVLDGFRFLISSPIVFIYNTSIIFFTLLFALFLRKRVFGI